MEKVSIAKYREEIEQAAWAASSCNVYTDASGASGLSEVPVLFVERTVPLEAEYTRKFFVDELVRMLGGCMLFRVMVLDSRYMSRYYCPVVRGREWVYSAR